MSFVRCPNPICCSSDTYVCENDGCSVCNDCAVAFRVCSCCNKKMAIFMAASNIDPLEYYHKRFNHDEEPVLFTKECIYKDQTIIIVWICDTCDYVSYGYRKDIAAVPQHDWADWDSQSYDSE